MAKIDVELIGDRLEAAGQIAVLAGAVEVVEHRQEIDQHAADRNLAGSLPFAVGPTAVVGVLGLQALQIGGALGEQRRVLVGRRPPPHRSSGGEAT